MNKQILALDCDQILFDYCSPFIAYAINKGYQLDLNSKFDSYNMSGWFTNMSSTQFVDLILEYNSHEHPPVYHYITKSLIDKLLEKYEVCAVTSYSDCPTTRDRRMNMLLGMGITNVHMLGLGESKLDTLQEIGTGIFVDDSPKHILEGIEAGWEVRTIRYPYNSGLEDKGVIYMDSLWELLDE